VDSRIDMAMYDAQFLANHSPTSTQAQAVADNLAGILGYGRQTPYGRASVDCVPVASFEQRPLSRAIRLNIYSYPCFAKSTIDWSFLMSSTLPTTIIVLVIGEPMTT